MIKTKQIIIKIYDFVKHGAPPILLTVVFSFLTMRTCGDEFEYFFIRFIFLILFAGIFHEMLKTRERDERRVKIDNGTFSPEDIDEII